MVPRKTLVIIFVLVTALLAAQAHSHVDLSLPHAQAHSCPVCTFSIWAIPAPLLVLGAFLLSHRLDFTQAAAAVVQSGPLSLSPRAPPLL